MEENRKNLIVASDGSNRAKNALKFSQRIFKNSNYFDKIIIASIIDPSKVYLPTELQPTQLEFNFRNQLLSNFPHSKYDVILQKKQIDAKTDILKIASARQAGLLSLGFNGRKSQLGNSGGHSLLGSSVQHSLQFSTIPFLVCKSKYLQKDYFTYAVCLDGSKKSLNGLKWLKKIVGEKDKIICLYAPHFNTQKVIRNSIQQSVENLCNTYIQLPLSGEPISTLINHINEDPNYDYDFVLAGNNGQRAQSEKKTFVGSGATKLLVQLNYNIILYPLY